MSIGFTHGFLSPRHGEHSAFLPCSCHESRDCRSFVSKLSPALNAYKDMTTDFMLCQIDYEKLAELANFKNQNSARACFGPIRKKLLEGCYAADAASASTSTPASATPKGKRSAAVASQEGDENPTPTKKPRGRPAKKAAAPAPLPVKEEEEEEREEQEDDDAPEADEV